MKLKTIAAALWFPAVLFTYPLTWLRLGGEKVPFFGDVKFFTPAELGILSLCVLLLFPENIISSFRRIRAFRYLCFAAAAVMVSALVRQFIFRDNWINSGGALFYAATPLAAAALADELKRILPFASAGTALLLLASGIFSDNFTGFTGNWNWTQALCAALIPGIFFLLNLKYPFRWSLAVCILFFILLKLFIPEVVSKAAVCAVAASASLLLIKKFIPRERKFLLPLIVWCGAAILFLLVLQIGNYDDSRFQLWRGTWNMIINTPVCGTGTEKFAELLPLYLPDEYFFTPFAANLHPHPHNIMLYYFASFGIAGIIYNFLLFFNVREKSGSDRLSVWIFTVLFFCGLFDVSADVPLGAWWMLSAAGIASAAGSETAERQTLHFFPLRCTAAAVILLSGIASATGNFRASSAYREGKLAMLANDAGAAAESFRRSLAIKPAAAVFYECAALNLHSGGDPRETLHLLERMKDESGCETYLHSNRLRSTALFRLGDIAGAKNALEKELGFFPYSIINTRLYILLLEKLRAPAGEIIAAGKHYLFLCDRRRISLKDAVNITPQEDDAPFPRSESGENR